MRATGALTIRDWLTANHADRRGREEWESLWMTATIIDFTLSDALNEMELCRALSTDDQVETGLRHLAAFAYEKRTGDRTGAGHIRAVRAPGNQNDVAPSWLVTDATTASRADYRRSEQVFAQARWRSGAAGAKGKGKGKKGKGKSKGAAEYEDA